jgi:thioredoxin reductase (NADPH)
MHDLVIIGSGPAGLTAALYAGRYRLNTLVLEKMGVGGQIILSPTIENYPGFPGGISTVELTDRFHKQIQELGINVEMSEVLAIYKASESENPVYKVVTKEKSYDTKSIIIATGSQPKKLGVPGEDKLIGRGISYCATCDAPFFRNKDIVVIGAGDRAIEEAIFLSSYAKKVTVIHRRNELRASEILQEKARSNPKIEFILESVVEEILGKDRVSAVRIKNVNTGSVFDLECQGAFVFTGIRPNTDFVKDILKIDDLGFIITDDNLKTSLDGVFACGDCRRKTLYQVVTACADGAIAAASVHNYLL